MKCSSFAYASVLAVGLAIGLVPGPAVETVRGSTESGRVRFHIVAIEETGQQRDVISEATVEGPPGTDFEIELRGARFEMTARFLTDSVVRDAIEVKAKLETRRLYGYSERDLPLYEEDVQSEDLSLDLREKIVLLPFGRPVADERLAIEITPSWAEPREPTESDLQIDILRPSPDGSVKIRAFHVAHRFGVTATLLRDGVEIAAGSEECRIEDSRTVPLRPTDPARPLGPDEVREVTVALRAILRERSVDLVDFAYRTATEQGSAIAPLGSAVEFRIADPDDPGSGGSHVLRILVQDVDRERSR